MAQSQITAPEEHVVAIGDLGESHASLRVLDGGAVRAMRESLLHHGQLTSLAAHRPREAPGSMEVLDGFKRLLAARELQWTHLRVRVLPVDGAAAKVVMSVLNRGRTLSELEEAWLVRALYREDRLGQPEIGRLLGRHKSWVSRRLLLAEGLDETVQVDVRLGLLAVSAAVALARLPRCNQRRAAEVVIGRGMTKAQAERLVSVVLSLPDGEHEAMIDAALEELLEESGAACGRRRPRERSPAESIGGDVAVLVRTCGRLQARLLERPLISFGEPAARLITDGLAGLLPVLGALQQSLLRVTKGVPDASVDDAGRA
jgi:ParB-like chromosome segregation protein Spo0J